MFELKRNKNITLNLVGSTVKIYNGKTFDIIKVSFKMVGFKSGSFSLTKKYLSHRVKIK